MVRPMETTILQGVRNILLHSGWEIFNVCIGEPGIFEAADVETEVRNHRFETSNPQLYVRVSEVHLIVTVITGKEIVNRQMPGTNPSIGPFISIEQRAQGIYPLLDEIGSHSRQLCNRLIAQWAVARCRKEHANHLLKLGFIVPNLCLEDTRVKFV